LGRGWQGVLLIPPARLPWRLLGVIGILGTRNFPLLLEAPAVGNAVVRKPSELAIGLGWKLQDSTREAGFPDGLIAAVFG
jgi:acyl-CoA reductase-like NAD-dependent aldehyde dehydrogenase